MKIATISILICCIWTVSSAIQPQEQIQRDERSSFQGSIEPVEASPVALYDAQYDLVRSASSPGVTKVVGRVRIENVSGRSIKVVRLHFVYTMMGFHMHYGAAAYDLARKEVREFSAENFNREPPVTPTAKALDLNGMALNVMATGAEFQDGSHWAAARTESHPIASWPNKAAASLALSGWRRDRVPPNVLLEIVDPTVVAYRLGTVTDTPSSFEVKLGQWSDLTQPERQRKGEVVEPGRSLSSDQMPGEVLDNGAVRQRPGMALFVAEVRFDDGHVWRQDTHREELLWDAN